jgi:heptosyltransferase-3
LKILIVQLTRLGDILSTLPAVSAIKREYPEAQIHLLVRQRFASGAESARFIDHLWKLDTAKLLGPLMSGQGEINGTLETLGHLISDLRTEKFDRIINLSFSPSSSFITHLISQNKIPVCGYTRTSDLFLHIPDEASRYFRAQVGLNRSNRLHVGDLFAWVCGVELVQSDWSCALGEVDSLKRSGIVCHLGASQSHKTWPADSWAALIRRLTENLNQTVSLVGSNTEKATAESIALQVGSSRVINLTGRTDFTELVRIIRGAELFIGADSGPLHVANCTQTRSLNLSVGNVRFWETGPIVPGSRVLVSREPQFLMSDAVFTHAESMLKNSSITDGAIECINSKGVRYEARADMTPIDFWPVVEWIYFNGPLPPWSPDLQVALGQIREICKMAFAQLDALFEAPKKVELIPVLDRIDELLDLMNKTIPPLTPLLEAFACEKENIPPGSREEVFYQTRLCYERLQKRSVTLNSEKQSKGHDHETKNLEP